MRIQLYWQGGDTDYEKNLCATEGAVGPGGTLVGPLDKNTGELWACCPVLYRKVLRKLYCAETGYEELHIAKLSHTISETQVQDGGAAGTDSTHETGTGASKPTRG